MEEVFGFCGCGAKHPVYAKDSLLTEQFINIETLKTSKKLKSGMVVETLGYYEVNDGGGAKYIIRDKKEDDVENDSIIFLNKGLVAEKIKDSILKFHSVADSSATYIVEFPNGKNMIIDTGISTQWNAIKNCIDSLGITKFDYMVITHFHGDHYGNIQNIINNYDVTNLKCWVGMKPDFENFGDKIEETEEDYENTITLFKNNGITPIVPENNSYEIISNDIKLHFLNTDSTLAEDYYNQIAEWHSTGQCNLNLFSLVTEIIHKDVCILTTGDIEKASEKAITPFLRKCHLMVVPHHGTNRDGYKPFFYATMPDYALCTYIGDEDANWFNPWFVEYMTLKEIGSKIITRRNTPVNGLYSFYSNGYSINTNAIGSGDTDKCKKPKLYGRFEELVNYATQETTKITLTELFENMDNGSTFCGDIIESFKTNYETLYNDLLEIFPMIDSGYQFEIYKSQTNSYRRSIKIFNYNYEFKAIANNIDNWTLTHGSGDTGDIEGIDNLIDTILKLPKGHYRCNYKDDIGSVLATNGFYALSIDVVTKKAGETCALINGIIRTTTTSSSDIARAITGFINTKAETPYIWFKTNN